MISKYTFLKLVQRSRSKRYVIVSHALDLSGAPYVLLDILIEMVEKVGGERIDLWVPNIDEKHLPTVEKLGINLKYYTKNDTDSLLDYKLNINKDDFVLMNTTAVEWNMRDRILHYLKTGKLKQLHWYVHEASPKYWLDNDNLTDRIKNLLSLEKIKFYVPGKKAAENYEQYYGYPVKLAPFRFTLDSKYKIDRSPDEFSNITFVVNGTVQGGNKAHTAIMFAFYEFFKEKYQGNENKYRDFNLQFIGLQDDYLSRQFVFVGEQLLGKHFSYTERLPREEVLEHIAKAQANITYSFTEVLPLNVMESMFMGQFLLRNSCSGVEEQLKNGENGFLLPEEDIKGFVDVLEKVLNKDTISNQKLADMGKVSQEIVQEYEDVSYLDYFLS